MIPRHRPEFGVIDLVRALSVRDQADLVHEISGRLGRTVARWVPSGRAGLALALSLVGARRAIVPAFNCWAVMEALQRARVEPLFVDIGPDLNPDLDQTIERIEEAPDRTTLVLTHQFGVPMSGVSHLLSLARERGVSVVEDAAAAIGARTDAGMAGSLGDCSVLSFQYTKSVFSGEGGLILMSESLGPADSELRDYEPVSLSSATHQWLKMAALSVLTHPRLYGWTIYRTLPASGTRNERKTSAPEARFRTLPSEWMQRLAALTMSRLDRVLDSRRRIARKYLEALTGSPVDLVPATADEAAAPIRFPMLVEGREWFVARCADSGLDLGRSFAYTCSDGGFPHAERVAASIVNLPLSACLEDSAGQVIEIARGVLSGKRGA